MKKLFICLIFAMLLGMAACSSVPSDTVDPPSSPPAPAEATDFAPPDSSGEAQPFVPQTGEELPPEAEGEDIEEEDGPEDVSSPSPYHTPEPSVPPEPAGEHDEPSEPDGESSDTENEEGTAGDETEERQEIPSDSLSGSYWSASMYSRMIYDGEEYMSVGDTPLLPGDETVNLLLCEDGEGLFRCSLWGPEDPDNGYLRWEASHHGGTEQLKIDLASGFTLYGSVSDDVMTLDYREGELTLTRLEYGPVGFELRPELTEGSWALESAEEDGEQYDAVEPGTRAYLSLTDGKADLYWYDGLLSFRSYSAEALDAELSWLPMYYGCGNECWSIDLTGCSDHRKAFSVTALSPDRLEMLVSTYSGTDPFPAVQCLYFSRVAPEETDSSGEPPYVTAGSTSELIGALHDGVTVTLKSGVYDITEWLDEHSLPDWSYIGDNRGKYGLFAGYSAGSKELVISGMSNITLRSEDPSAPARIVCSSPDAGVLSFNGCSGISLENLVITHSGAANSSVGSIVTAEYCGGIGITGCDLSGSDAYALECYGCAGLYIASGRIHDCLYGCAVLSSCSSVEIHDTAFFDCSGPSAFDLEGSDVLFSSCSFRDIGDSLISSDDGSDIRFDGCNFDTAAPASPEADENADVNAPSDDAPRDQAAGD